MFNPSPVILPSRSTLHDIHYHRIIATAFPDYQRKPQLLRKTNASTTIENSPQPKIDTLDLVNMRISCG